MSDDTKEKEVFIYQIPILVDEDFLDFFQYYKNNTVASPIFPGFIDQSPFKSLFLNPDQNPELIEGITNGLVIKSMLDSELIESFNTFLKYKKAGITGPDPEPAKVEEEPKTNVINIFEYKKKKDGEDTV